MRRFKKLHRHFAILGLNDVADSRFVQKSPDDFAHGALVIDDQSLNIRHPSVAVHRCVFVGQDGSVIVFAPFGNRAVWI